MRHLLHLVRRWWGASLAKAPPVEHEVWAESWLLPGERRLWRRLNDADRAHAVMVARRFQALAPCAGRAGLAAALLHACGKADSALSTTARVVATVVGPRTMTMRRYHDHEIIGARWLHDAGSDPVTVALVGRYPDAPTDLRRALDAADDL
jgi:hypothetical protein